MVPAAAAAAAAAANNPGALLDDLELTAQRNLALARLNSSPLPPIQTSHLANAAAAAANGGGQPTNAAEQSLYSHLYGKEMGLMRKLSNMEDYPNHAATARNYQQLLQHPDGVIPPGAAAAAAAAAAHQMQQQQQQQQQQNFGTHPHANKFNQFNYPNQGGLLKPCYDYASQHQQLQSAGPNGSATAASTQQMKKEMFNLGGSNGGADLYNPRPPSVSTAQSASSANGPTNNSTASSMANGGSGGASNGSLSFMNLHQPSSAAAAAAAAAAAMYANHFGPGSNKHQENGPDSLADFNPMRNGPNPNNNNNGINHIKSANDTTMAAMARSSIMNNLNNNLNKIEPNTDTALNDNNNNPHNHNHHHQQQQHHHPSSFHHPMAMNGGGNQELPGNNGSGPGADDDNDKLSSPMTGTSTLTNNTADLHDTEHDSNDDGYTIL
ncbi:putative uncharacterized protein DDB_G0286901 [Uranotaenia lowii]|uniref:putative uncharacterized protein DDB_G0286901 n=1 Tax=Uranotaenia lowii TaxID=190385 RepID=UPI00247A7C59|nr:putative uncharacterized protein DDB_G0286901 [Uranotaenia lowii]